MFMIALAAFHLLWTYSVTSRAAFVSLFVFFICLCMFFLCWDENKLYFPLPHGLVLMAAEDTDGGTTVACMYDGARKAE